MGELNFTGRILKSETEDHREAYDWTMTNAKPGDFIELGNDEVVYLFQAWPVIIIGDMNKDILHRFKEGGSELNQALDRYHALKEDDSKTPVDQLWQSKPTKAYKYVEGKETLIRLINEHGYESEESIAGWTSFIDLTTGKNSWKHIDGRELEEASAYDLAANKEAYLQEIAKAAGKPHNTEAMKQLMRSEPDEPEQDDLPGLSI